MMKRQAAISPPDESYRCPPLRRTGNGGTGGIASDYQLSVLKDPLDEEDYEGEALSTGELEIRIIGDDRFTTRVDTSDVNGFQHSAQCGKEKESVVIKIQNRADILSHGNIEGRRLVLDIIDGALQGPAATYENTKKVVRIEKYTLKIGHPDYSNPPGRRPVSFDLSEINNIYVVGAGKAVQMIGLALEDVLGDRITDAQFNLKKGEPIYLKKIPVTHAAHPIPDEDSVKGAVKILELLKKARKGDIVFVCISGGATSLHAHPAPGISLEDLQQVYKVLYFECGATMPESNAVRNLLVDLSGRYAKIVSGATLVYLLANEYPPKIRAHTFEQISLIDTYGRAVRVLHKYRCWERVPQSVRDYLSKADPVNLFPTDEDRKHCNYMEFRVMHPGYLIEAAQRTAEELGITASILATTMNDIEARPMGEFLANIAQEIEVFGRPFEPPCVLLVGGEAVVPIGKSTGIGGRNKELILAAAAIIDGSRNIVIGSVDSDGTDGPTNTAGGIADGQTMNRLHEEGIDLHAELNNHNSEFVLNRLDDIIHTGSTSTNMRDIRVIYIGGRKND